MAEDTKDDTSTFFEEVIRYKENKSDHEIAIIVVSHAVYDLKLFLKALENIGKSRIFKVIFKSSHPNEVIRKQISEAYPNALTHNITKEKLKNDISTINNIAKELESNEKLLIIDIGGYFAPCLPIISKNQYLSQKIIGIVEDTENGHQKYEKYISQSTVPVFSVARSQQKKTEDYNVGKSIVNTTDMLLKNIQVRSEEMICGVIGFGKIGSSIADHLRQKRVKQLLIFDHDPVILMRAASLDFSIASKADILEKCTIIYCATGQKSLSQKDLEEISNKDVYIASCTSSDDEFECEVSKFKKVCHNPDLISKTDISIYQSRNGNNVNFLANGNAINFYLQNNALGNYIRGVQAAIIIAALKILNEPSQTFQAIREISYVEEKVISKLWLKYFNRTNCSTINRFLSQTQKKQKFIRPQDLKEIERILAVNRYCCVYGKNGTGKTELVRKLAKQNEEHYELILYIDENNSSTAYKDIAKKINISLTSKNQEELLHEIFSKLIYERNFFIIFDNIQDQRKIKDIINIFKSTLLKKKKFDQKTESKEFLSNLVCISDTPHINMEAAYEIKPLTLDNIQTLTKQHYSNLGYNPELLHHLSQGYPFLLDKIFSYLEWSSMPLQQYYEKVLSSLSTYGNDQPLQRHQKAIIEFSIGEINKWIERTIPLAYKLLLFSSLLDGELIQPELFIKFFTNELRLNNSDTFKYAISLLDRYGFIETCETSTSNGSSYYMRRLTQALLQSMYLEKEFSEYFFYALRTISVFFEYLPYRKQKDLERCYEYMSHAHIVIKNLLQHQNKIDFYISLKEKDFILLATFLHQLGSIHLYEHRDYLTSLIYYKEIKELLKRTLNNSYSNEQHTFFKLLADNGIMINKSHAWKKEKENKTKFEKLLKKLEILQNEPCLQESNHIFSKLDLAINQTYIQKYLGYHYLTNGKYKIGTDRLLTCLTHLNKIKSEIKKTENTHNKELIDKTLALTYHALGSLHLLLDKYRAIFSVLGHESAKDSLESAKRYLKKAIELRKSILDNKHPDLARSMYKYSEVLWKKHKKDKTDTSLNDQPPLLEALSYCKAAIHAQEKHLLPDHINLQSSKELKRKIKVHLNQKIYAYNYSSFFTNPWTPAKKSQSLSAHVVSDNSPKKVLTYPNDQDIEDSQQQQNIKEKPKDTSSKNPPSPY